MYWNQHDAKCAHVEARGCPATQLTEQHWRKVCQSPNGWLVAGAAIRFSGNESPRREMTRTAASKWICILASLLAFLQSVFHIKICHHEECVQLWSATLTYKVACRNVIDVNLFIGFSQREHPSKVLEGSWSPTRRGWKELRGTGRLHFNLHNRS